MNPRDKQWNKLNQELIEHSQNFDWGLYRNIRFDMGTFLEEEARLKDALVTYLEVCYIDLNGPCNMGGTKDPSILKEFPPFNPKDLGFLAPGVLNKIEKIMKKLNFNIENIEEIFFTHNQQIEKSLKLPLSVNNAWKNIKDELLK